MKKTAFVQKFVLLCMSLSMAAGFLVCGLACSGNVEDTDPPMESQQGGREHLEGQEPMMPQHEVSTYSSNDIYLEEVTKDALVELLQHQIKHHELILLSQSTMDSRYEGYDPDIVPIYQDRKSKLELLVGKVEMTDEQDTDSLEKYYEEYLQVVS